MSPPPPGPTRPSPVGDDRGGRVRRAGLAALGDAVLLGWGLAAGWLVGGELLIAVWLQTAVLLVAVPVLLLRAAHLAPDDPAVDGPPRPEPGQRPAAGWGVIASTDGRVSLHGRTAARVLGGFFLLHYGMFTLVLGGFALALALRVGLEGVTTLSLGLLVLRSVLASVPTVLADAAFLAADGSSNLGGRAQAVMQRAYLRMVPLHLGVVAIGGPLRVLGPEVAAVGVVVVVVAITFVGALWRYPTDGALAAAAATAAAQTGAARAGAGPAPGWTITWGRSTQLPGAAAADPSVPPPVWARTAGAEPAAGPPPPPGPPPPAAAPPPPPGPPPPPPSPPR